MRQEKDGHLNTIVGRGGSGKSILALQLVTNLLKRENGPHPNRPHAAFYFTLEASPQELKRQLLQFTWGRDYFTQWMKRGFQQKDELRVTGDDEYANGLYLLHIPSPVESLNSLNLQIRQTIARQLHQIGGLEAIVIDPIGAVSSGDDFRTSLSQLKELAGWHRTFIFLLTEKYAFDKYTSIEHYSQSIIHLEHDPGQQQHRRLYVQKARGQGFRSGYHLFQLEQTRTEQQSGKSKTETSISKGIRIFPSIEAQAAYAHERLSERQQKAKTASRAKSKTRDRVQSLDSESVPFFPDEDKNPFLGDDGDNSTNSEREEARRSERIQVGSAVFLMGPPGTFKEFVASQFAEAARKEGGATIYVSFKADIRGEQETFDTRNDIKGKLNPTIYFFDARSPLLTPEEVLFTVQRAIMARRDENSAKFRRAVIWGLRRLYDFPNFREGRAVQFLEALVTLLKAERITSLLVDWPDEKRPSSVPIVDLCQYIFLTRVCFSKESPEVREMKNSEEVMKLLSGLWTSKTMQIALMRVQRTRRGVHHDQGAVLRQLKNGTFDRLRRNDRESFERLWLNCGVKWEEDISLLS